MYFCLVESFMLEYPHTIIVCGIKVDWIYSKNGHEHLQWLIEDS